MNGRQNFICHKIFWAHFLRVRVDKCASLFFLMPFLRATSVIISHFFYKIRRIILKKTINWILFHRKTHKPLESKVHSWMFETATNSQLTYKLINMLLEASTWLVYDDIQKTSSILTQNWRLNILLTVWNILVVKSKFDRSKISSSLCRLLSELMKVYLILELYHHDFFLSFSVGQIRKLKCDILSSFQWISMDGKFLFSSSKHFFHNVFFFAD